jgi:hypothetical protein
MNFSTQNSARYTLWCVAPFLFSASVISGCFAAKPVDQEASVNQKESSSNQRISSSENLREDSVKNRTEETKSSATSASQRGKAQFRDVSRQIGLRYQAFNDEVPNRYFLPEVMGAGIAWIDFDRDGWLDLFLANGCELDGPIDPDHHCRFYRNGMGQSFTEATKESQAGVTLFGQGCAVGDFDADGFSDLFIGGYGADILLRNNGDGTFQNVTQVAAISDPRWSSSSFWADLDADGLLDLFVVNYVDVSLSKHRICHYGTARGYCGPGSFEAQEDCVYHNLGDGTFAEVANGWGLNAEGGKGLAAAAADFDLDLVPEIYVANDMTSNFFFAKQPDSPLRYKEIASESGCAVSGSGMNEASMGVAIADFNCDGLPDIFLTHYYHTKNTLYKNLGKRLFDDDSYYSKAAATSTESLGFGVVVMDYNRDRFPDLMIATGHVLGPEQQPQKMTSQLLENVGGIFQDISAAAGDYFRVPGIARCAAAADFDNDGDLDIAVSQVGSPFVLLRNDSTTPNRPWTGVTLKTSNRIPPIGGHVVCRLKDREWIYPIVAGGSYLAAADCRLLLAGWESAEGEPDVEIHWPSGRIDRLGPLPQGRYLEILEGQTPRTSP